MPASSLSPASATKSSPKRSPRSTTLCVRGRQLGGCGLSTTITPMPREELPSWPDHGLEAHPIWLASKLPECGSLADWARAYEMSVNSAARTLTESRAWVDLVDQLRGLSERHEANEGEPLVVGALTMKTKSYESVCDKAYRHNVLQRETEPDASEIVGPHNWLTRLGDVLRGTVVVLTLDGVRPVCDLIVQVLNSHQMDAQVTPRSMLRGYYAMHIDFLWTADASVGGKTERRAFAVELQVKTFMHDSLGRLTHPQYEARRTTAGGLTESSWAWEPESREFNTNLLGHIIQYVDGAIVNLRRSSGA